MSVSDFRNAQHTIVISDIHLADPQEVLPKNPLWKKFKQPEFFIDEMFEKFLSHMQSKILAPIELVFNGDTFDFDSVMALPKSSKTDAFNIKYSWLEKLRGLTSEEPKSRFKMKVILDSHPVWIKAVRDFILNGNRVVFLIGNHDLELHWPSVRQDIVTKLDLPEDKQSLVRFCEWFYISNHDTLIEHGNQYDAYCLCSNPVHPLIKKGSKVYVRLPFGNLAGRYMINGMGLMNPHATQSFIRGSFWEYLKFYYKYVMRIEPLLAWTWLWGAFVTLVNSLADGFLPALRDPLTVNSRMEDIAKRANATVLVVLGLNEMHVHPAIFNPFKILRELWLDRVLLLGVIFLGSFEIVTLLNIVTHISLWWSLIPAILCFPLFLSYARSIQSEVDDTQRAAFKVAPLTAQIAGVKRIVQGHTHIEGHHQVEGVEVLNTGTWSPAYYDVHCAEPYGRKCFAWIRFNDKEDAAAPEIGRISELYEWKTDHIELIKKS